MESDPTFALGSFSIAGSVPFAGMMRGNQVIALAGLGDDALTGGLLEVLENWEANLPRLGRAAQRWAARVPELAKRAVPVDQLVVCAPFRPRQIFAVGANYRKHVIDLVMGDPDMRFGDMEQVPDETTRREAIELMMDERASNAVPYVFSKLPSAVAGPFDPLKLPEDSQKVDWECELAVVIGRAARNVPVDDALSFVAGYAIANDITARDFVFRRDVKVMGTDWIASKSRPGFLPLGPYLVPASAVDPTSLTIRLSVNQRIMQDERTSDMLIGIDRQIAYLSSQIQLLPGDVICTGSPAGNGSHHGVFLKPGDYMVASITGLGEQRVHCI